MSLVLGIEVKRLTNEEHFEEEMETILLTDDEGNEYLFELIAELEIEEENYKVLVPLDEDEILEEETEVEIRIMKVVYDEEGNEYLCDIEDDEEWERVADAWQELIEEGELL